MTCDYAGFSTLDFIRRVSRVFGQRRLVVVSQRFHVARARFLARSDGLEAYGCAAADAGRRWQLRVRAREVLARGQAAFAVALARSHRFLGARERWCSPGPIDRPAAGTKKPGSPRGVAGF